MKCKECRFWTKTQDGNDYEPGEGECRRFPPSFTSTDLGSPYSYSNTAWGNPITTDYHWCGEFKSTRGRKNG